MGVVVRGRAVERLVQLPRSSRGGRGGDKVAFHWEEPGDTRTITYSDLLDDVCRLANALASLGVRKGDRVNIYLGMVPELPIAMLACARIGAPHSVVFGGFSAEALRDRIIDAEAKVLITADGAWRRGTIVPLKDNADEAVSECPSIEHVITVKRCGNEHSFTEGRDLWYHELVADQPTECEPEPMGRRICSTCCTRAARRKAEGHRPYHGWVHDAGCRDPPHDLRPARGRRVLVRRRLRWVTGHSYIVYGPLANHTTGIMYEGALTGPTRSVVEHRRALRGHDPLHRADRDPGVHAMGSRAPRATRSVLAPAAGSVGEPINPEAWIWYWKVIGTEHCPVVDTWWQTETGAILITPLPGSPR